MIRAPRRDAKTEFSFSFLLFFSVFLALAGIAWAGAEARFLAQTEAEVQPDATPQIQEVKPNQAAVGDEVTVTIGGQNFSSGAYVSFSDPRVQVVSTRRISATQLETHLAIGKKARPGAVTLYVSNPASTVAETPFTIVEASPPPAAPSPPAAPPAQPGPATPPPPAAPPTQPGPPTPPAPAAPATQPGPATPPAPAAPPAQPGPATPPAPAPPPAQPTTTVIQPTAPAAPEVLKVVPSSAQRGAKTTLKITGKNFDPRARIAFSNSDVRVVEVGPAQATEITATIQIAAGAKTGSTSLFVVNPDDREVEVAFEVTDGAGAKTAAATGPASAALSAEQTFSVFNVGSAGSVLTGKSKATLVVSGGKLKCEEGGKEVFSAALADIKEVGENSILGVKSGVFHIILKNGKTYNFMASSLKHSDTQAIVTALQAVVK